MSKIIIFSALIAIVYSKQFDCVQNSTNGLCLFNSKNYNPGEEWFSNDCKKWKCVKGSSENEIILEGQSCDYKKIKDKKCEPKTIPGKNYPECCTNDVVCDGDRPNHDNARVICSAGGDYDPYWAKVDQDWKELDRQRAQAGQQYGQSRSQVGRPSIPSGVRVRRSASPYDPTWEAVDEAKREYDLEQEARERDRNRMHNERNREQEHVPYPYL